MEKYERRLAAPRNGATRVSGRFASGKGDTSDRRTDTRGHAMQCARQNMVKASISESVRPYSRIFGMRFAHRGGSKAERMSSDTVYLCIGVYKESKKNKLRGGPTLVQVKMRMYQVMTYRAGLGYTRPLAMRHKPILKARASHKLLAQTHSRTESTEQRPMQADRRATECTDGA